MDSPHNVKKKFFNARFHQVSTDEVYGSIKKDSFTENSPYLPNSPYSASKAAADMLVRSYFKTYGLNTTISISSNNYGLNQNIEKLIPKIIFSLKNNKKVSIYGDGSNIRNWLHVTDNSYRNRFNFNFSQNGESIILEVMMSLQTYQFTKKSILKYLMTQTIIQKMAFTKDRPGHDYRYSINSQKIKDHFHWKLIRNFKDEIKKIIKQY